MNCCQKKKSVTETVELHHIAQISQENPNTMQGFRQKNQQTDVVTSQPNSGRAENPASAKQEGGGSCLSSCIACWKGFGSTVCCLTEEEYYALAQEDMLLNMNREQSISLTQDLRNQRAELMRKHGFEEKDLDHCCTKAWWRRCFDK